MKRINILVIMILLAGTAHAQSVAELARKERLRQMETESKRTIKKIGDPVVVAPVVPVAEETSAKETREPEVKQDPKSFEASYKDQRVDLLTRRGQLLQHLTEVIHDREAVKKIEDELFQIQEKSAQLKIERLQKLAEKQ